MAVWTLPLQLMVVIISLHLTGGQNNPYGSNPKDPLENQITGNLFFMDSNSDCNGPTRNIYNVEATIKGHNGAGGVQRGPSSCTISIKTEGQFLGYLLLIEIISMDIRDPGTYVSIYDGDASQVPLGSFDQGSSHNLNRRTLKTSGNSATFIMTRTDVEQLNFDILIKITPIRGGLKPGDDGYIEDFDKYPQEIIVGLIGGFYGFILIIVVTVIFLYYRSLLGKDKKWETVQLDVMKTNSRFDTSRSQPSQAWSTAPSRAPPPESYYSHGASAAYPPGKYLPSQGDISSSVYKYDDSFQTRRLMNGERDRMDPPKYPRSNQTFEEPEEEDDADNFKEKVITARVRTKPRGRGRPPSYEEAVSSQGSEDISEEESDEKSEYSSDDSIHKRSVTSSERSSRTRSSRSYSETESEEESEDDSRRGRRPRGARGGNRRRRPHDKPRHRRRRLSSSDGDGPTRSRQPRQPTMAQPAPMPYPAYPPGGQFVPVMGPAPQFQPMPVMQPYPPPQYPEGQRPPAPDSQEVQPTEPPVYSYLVRRGYTPLDARSGSQGSLPGSNRSDPAKLEEPDVRLNSGVEYMRR